MEASLKVGANRLTNIRRTRGLGDAVKTTQTIEKEVEHKEETPNLISHMFSQTGKGSLMQRMASPIPAEKNKSYGGGETMNLGSTMAGTTLGQTKYRFNATHTSPFSETVARGMVTGVGLLGK
jgi:hypothetical protein